MSNRHLPAGQHIPGGVGGVPGAEMAGGPGGPRRRQPPQYAPQYHHHHHHHNFNPMYAGYAQYAQQQYYGTSPQYQNGGYQNGQYQGGYYQPGQFQAGQYQNAQYQNGGMASPGYMPYPQNYARSPPSMHNYVPMAGVSVPPNYPRAVQQSPALSTPYQPPPPPAPLPSHTPSSTHSSQMFPPPTPPTPQTQETANYPPAIVTAPTFTPSTPSVSIPAPEPLQEIVQETPQEATPEPVQAHVDDGVSEPSPVETKAPFRAPLPWLSRPELAFPTRTVKSRKRRKPLNADSQAVSLPAEQHQAATEQAEQDTSSKSTVVSTPATDKTSEPTPKVTPATPPSIQRSRAGTATSTTSATPTANGKTSTRPAIPAIPVLPVFPKTAKTAKASSTEKPESAEVAEDAVTHNVMLKDIVTASAEDTASATETIPAPAPAKAAPTSWANLFANRSAAAKSIGPSGTTVANVNGSGLETVAGSTNGSSSFSKTNANSVAEAIHAYRVGSHDRISFLEPRGLINTGNMCYMNSVLQVLMFCVPFYDFLDQVSKRAVHSFKSDTPLIDAMIMFMHEYKVLKSGLSIDQLARTLKSEELERYGEPFTPEFVYEAIRQLPRFASMRRGHQQDAEEFLGFLLQSLDDECTTVMSNSLHENAPGSAAASSASDPSGDWLEVGRKQRAAVTRSSGSNSQTPLTKIFGGLLRSEFRVPGLKDSITTEPYQPLQLDIGAPDIRNVVDALRGLTRPERLQGDFNSPRGKDVTATKQVFIETLPPVLILHLKRFQFDPEVNGTVKIWKKVGYPLELEIPREALSRQTRQTLNDGVMPKYRLISVVYHHGKNASGGHYTVDVRRQEGREWIRLDDTVIRRVRSEDVAEGGEEEEVKDTRKDNTSAGAPGNRFGTMADEDAGDDDGWKQVTVSTEGKKRWSNVASSGSNGIAKGKQIKDSIKDNKVAYLLFYQRV